MKNKKKNCHIKKGDIVQVISGEKKGVIGKINSINLKQFFVFIEGVAPRIKYSKATSNTEAKKIELPIPIHISNVMLWDNQKNLASRIGYKIINEKKYRYFKKSGNIL